MYEWKVTMVNGKEYVIKCDIKGTVEMNNNLFGTNNGVLNLSSWNALDTEGKALDVVLASDKIVSVEYNIGK